MLGSAASQNKGMAERRSEALATPLASNSKCAPSSRLVIPVRAGEAAPNCLCRCRGFQMLAAMGYRPGMGIGKTVVGRAAPLDVNLKADRTGLGVYEAKRRREQAAQQERQERGAPCSTEAPERCSECIATAGLRMLN